VRRVPNGGKHPDLRERSPFAGRRVSPDLGWLIVGQRDLQPFALIEPVTRGCSSSFGGGAPLATSFMRRRMRGEGGSFAPGCSAHATHCHRFNSSPAQPAGRSERPPAKRRYEGRWPFTLKPYGGLACAGRRLWMGLTWLAAREGKRGGCLTQKVVRSRRARIGRSRGRARAS